MGFILTLILLSGVRHERIIDEVSRYIQFIVDTRKNTYTRVYMDRDENYYVVCAEGKLFSNLAEYYYYPEFHVTKIDRDGNVIEYDKKLEFPWEYKPWRNLDFFPFTTLLLRPDGVLWTVVIRPDGSKERDVYVYDSELNFQGRVRCEGCRKVKLSRGIIFYDDENNIYGFMPSHIFHRDKMFMFTVDFNGFYVKQSECEGWYAWYIGEKKLTKEFVGNGNLKKEWIKWLPYEEGRKVLKDCWEGKRNMKKFALIDDITFAWCNGRILGIAKIRLGGIGPRNLVVLFEYNDELRMVKEPEVIDLEEVALYRYEDVYIPRGFYRVDDGYFYVYSRDPDEKLAYIVKVSKDGEIIPPEVGIKKGVSKDIESLPDDMPVFFQYGDGLMVFGFDRDGGVYAKERIRFKGKDRR